MRVLVGEDLPKGIVGLLTEFGHRAVHVQDTTLRGRSDADVFAEAQQQQALLWTADVGFASIQAFPRGDHYGIVVFRFPDHYRREQILALARRFLKSADLESLTGALAIVGPASYRVRR